MPYALLNSTRSVALISNTKFLEKTINTLNTYPPVEQKTCSGGGGWSNDPKVWGRHLWYYLHTCAMNYPENPTPTDKKEMEEWLKTLPVTLPCRNCSKHYRSYIEENASRLPEICSTRENLFNFLVDIHNKVNARTDKEEMSYDDARKLYGGNNTCSTCQA